MIEPPHKRQADPSCPPDSSWERRCIERVRRGERRAFGAIYEAYAGRIYARVLMPRLGQAAAAEDALAETFRTALEKLDSFEDQGHGVYPWLARIAAHKATDMHRVKARTRRALASFEGLMAPLVPEQGQPFAAECAPDLRVVRARIADVLGRINPRYGRAIELRFLEDRSREECAEVLELKIGTFDVLVLRALRAFRKEWIATVEEEL